ncbi:methylated-DNA--[protein]-cysteine S-methyltransferase [Tardiphaga sp.]|jgi:methylated-DNA-[protein]-cysteine S-methyltransferase|uniref:methylated-DNA--[protein]-cysteine S-methyltransferase n=1 Tax=Tardiphaga sp. TaxID=1926292 RepID=UPI0019B0C986|nr:methylated-DNA--[protein]-cysteine S-methyltransferase [Tardiphaga sp.]MBC7578932.1 methylated-DNA--[protein]-cysteine S-methyltransferase [Tardiphaga sp.]
MAGREYTLFDTPVGRCGIAWGRAGIVGVRLPEAREIETRRRLLQQFPEAREMRPPAEIETAIEGIATLLRGETCFLTEILLDMAHLPPFNRRVYDTVRLIPRGQTRTYAELAARLGASGAMHAVGQAINRNPFAILVPCHRTLAAAGQTSGFAGNAGTVTKFRLLSIEGALADRGPSLFDALLSGAPPRAPS